MPGRVQPASNEQTVTVGLIADPGIASKVMMRVARSLPRALTQAAGHGTVRWQIETGCEELPLDEDGQMPLGHIGGLQRGQHGWDLVVLITDLARSTGDEPLLADFGEAEGTGLVSLPALGVVRLVGRARRTIVELVVDYLLGPLLERRGVDVGTASHGHRLGTKSVFVGRVRSCRQGNEMHLVLIGLGRWTRLLLGMVRTNRPWRLVPNLSPALAGGAAGAAFGIFYTSIWPLSDAFVAWRFLLVSVLAVATMSGWLIIYNRLWVYPSDQVPSREARLSNAVTLLTIGSGVLCMYVLLFLATLAAGSVVIPPSYLAGVLGHPVGPIDFVDVAWLAASLGIFAGALGSGLADRDAVVSAAFSRRERQRREQVSDQDGSDSDHSDQQDGRD